MQEPKLRTYHCGGEAFRACGQNCAEGFKADRAAGAIYGTVEGYLCWERASYGEGFCAYCREMDAQIVAHNMTNDA